MSRVEFFERKIGGINNPVRIDIFSSRAANLMLGVTTTLQDGDLGIMRISACRLSLEDNLNRGT
jgi:hypothetical protein